MKDMVGIEGYICMVDEALHQLPESEAKRVVVNMFTMLETAINKLLSESDTGDTK